MYMILEDSMFAHVFAHACVSCQVHFSQTFSSLHGPVHKTWIQLMLLRLLDCRTMASFEEYMLAEARFVTSSCAAVIHATNSVVRLWKYMVQRSDLTLTCLDCITHVKTAQVYFWTMTMIVTHGQALRSDAIAVSIQLFQIVQVSLSKFLVGV